jgi:uncharacterized protein YndB with AHSA1/START domain
MNIYNKTLNEPVIVRVKHRFNAPPDRVFDAWLDREKLGKWMFGPGVRDEEIVRLMIDAQVGGSFSFLVRRQGQEIDHVGTYVEIDRPRRLVFTWGIAGESENESRVIIDIVPQETGCELTLIHELDSKWKDYADLTIAAWKNMLDHLTEILDNKDS